MKPETRNRWLAEIDGFFRDARGTRNVFTVISLLAGLTVVCLPWVIVLKDYANPERIDTLVYANFFLVIVASVTDALLGMIMEHGFWKSRKAPDAVNQQFGDNATNNQVGPDGNPLPQN